MVTLGTDKATLAAASESKLCWIVLNALKMNGLLACSIVGAKGVPALHLPGSLALLFGE
jgi:hypothetical protein